MDRSFLSRREVIDASRQLVCIRLATYEDPAEAVLLKNLVRTGSGELENTAFCLLAPDGRTRIARSARGIGEVFGTAKLFAVGLSQAADRYPAKPATDGAPLPLVKTVPLALNVAAADNQPLIVLAGSDGVMRSAAEGRVAALAWSAEFVGRFVYTSTGASDDLLTIRGDKRHGELLLVQPEKFGRSGVVLSHCPLNGNTETLTKCLREGLEHFKNDDKSFATHVREGHRQRVFWETPVPVTDPHELQARQRGRQVGAAGKTP
jgi:hypothetical protein